MKKCPPNGGGEECPRVELIVPLSTEWNSHITICHALHKHVRQTVYKNAITTLIESKQTYSKLS